MRRGRGRIPSAGRRLARIFWGRTPARRDWIDPVNLVLVAGGGLAALGLGWSRDVTLPLQDLAPMLVGSALVQPALEELFFRGFLQGRLLSLCPLRRRVAGISPANAVTTLAFGGLHLLHTPLEHALLVMMPSLAYGYLRERFGGVALPLIQHAAHNGLLFIGFAL